MSLARSTFVQRHSTFQAAAQNSALVDTGPTVSGASTVAAALRNGLCVVGFTILEDFLRQRVEEVFGGIRAGGLTFSQLPKSLRDIATVQAISGVAYRARLERNSGGDTEKFVQRHAALIASTASTQYSFSSLGFGGNQPNLTSDEIGKVLKCLQVKSPWEQMDALVSRIGLGVLSCKDAFTAAAGRRHRAAHTPTAAISTSELVSYGKESLAIALTFDLLISRAVIYLRKGDISFCADTFRFSEAEVSLRFLEQRKKTKWASVRERLTRASKVDSNLATLEKWTVSQCKRLGEALIVRDRSGVAISWQVPAAD